MEIGIARRRWRGWPIARPRRTWGPGFEATGLVVIAVFPLQLAIDRTRSWGVSAGGRPRGGGVSVGQSKFAETRGRIGHARNREQLAKPIDAAPPAKGRELVRELKRTPRDLAEILKLVEDDGEDDEKEGGTAGRCALRPRGRDPVPDLNCNNRIKRHLRCVRFREAMAGAQ